MPSKQHTFKNYDNAARFANRCRKTMMVLMTPEETYIVATGAEAKRLIDARAAVDAKYPQETFDQWEDEDAERGES
jgi:hypothetical protein